MADEAYDKIAKPVMSQIAEAVRWVQSQEPQRLDLRRNYPVGAGGTKPKLVKNGTTDKIGGLTSEVLCYIVDEDGNHSSDAATRITVNFDQGFENMVFPATAPTTDQNTEPAYCCYVIPWKDGKYKAISGGIGYFEGTYLGTNLVLPGIGGASVPNVTATTFCDESLIDGVTVGVQRYNKTLRIVGVCCGEPPA